MTSTLDALWGHPACGAFSVQSTVIAMPHVACPCSTVCCALETSRKHQSERIGGAEYRPLSASIPFLYIFSFCIDRAPGRYAIEDFTSNNLHQLLCKAANSSRANCGKRVPEIDYKMANVYHSVDDANIHISSIMKQRFNDDDDHADVGSDRLSDDDFFAENEGDLPSDESIPAYLRDPIVIGYAFGKKKMATMGVVMAEASKAKVTTTVGPPPAPPPTESATSSAPSDTTIHIANNKGGEGQNSLRTQEFEEDVSVEHSSTSHVDLTRSEAGNDNAFPTRPLLAEERMRDEKSLMSVQKQNPATHLTVDALNSMEPDKPTRTVFSLGYGNDHTSLKHIVRYFQSSCSSAASATETTVSTKTWISNGNLTTASKQQPQAQHSASASSSATYHYPVRLSFVPLDPNHSLEEQQGGKFDLILHKLTEDILSCSLNDKDNGGKAKDSSYSASFRRVSRLRQYHRDHPEACMVDDPSHVQTLMSRSDIGHVLQKCLRNVQSASGIPVCSPKFVECTPRDIESTRSECYREVAQSLMNQLHESRMTTFPLIAKPLIAAGTKQSHSMAVLLSPEALVPFLEGRQRQQRHVPGKATSSTAAASDKRKTIVSPRQREFVLQEYVNHDAVLYKVYVLGDIVKVYQRPSLPNLPKVNIQPQKRENVKSKATPPDDVSCSSRTRGTFVEFDSQRPYPRLQDFGIRDTGNKVTHSAQPLPTTNSIATAAKKQISSSTTATNDAVVTDMEVRPIVYALKRAFGLELFGFDILVTHDNIDSTMMNGASDEEEICREKRDTGSDLRRQPHQGQRMLVVDVNYFPSYKEVPNFPSLLAHYLTQRVLQSREEAALKKRQHEHGGQPQESNSP